MLNSSIHVLNNTISSMGELLLDSIENLNGTIGEVNKRLESLDLEGPADISDSDLRKVTGRLDKEKEKLNEEYSKKIERADSAMSAQRGVIAQVLVMLTALSTATLSTNPKGEAVVIDLFIPVLIALGTSFCVAVFLCISKLKGVSYEMNLLVEKKDKFLNKLDQFDRIVSQSYTSFVAEYPLSLLEVQEKVDTCLELKAKVDNIKRETKRIKNIVIYYYIELFVITFLSVVQVALLLVIIITTKHKDNSSRNSVPSPPPS